MSSAGFTNCGGVGAKIAAVAFFMVLGSGCPDPQGEFDSFAERYDSINNEGGGGTGGAAECPALAEGDADGKYLFTLSAKLNAKKAFALDATVVTHTAAEGFTLDLTLQPLLGSDQTTPVGDPIVAEGLPVNADGTFEWDFGDVTLIADANPISPRDVETTLQIQGQLCGGTDFICGDVTGTVSKPLAGFDLKGSSFTMQRYDTELPTPLINCDKDPAVYE